MIWWVFGTLQFFQIALSIMTLYVLIMFVKEPSLFQGLGGLGFFYPMLWIILLPVYLLTYFKISKATVIPIEEKKSLFKRVFWIDVLFLVVFAGALFGYSLIYTLSEKSNIGKTAEIPRDLRDIDRDIGVFTSIMLIIIPLGLLTIKNLFFKKGLHK